ncbi:MAG: DUF4959 domain-containing protein [Prevotellaceae bacterium]|nr:DUF4959 domain-containing protein [Prevotellaceae bacterium]
MNKTLIILSLFAFIAFCACEDENNAVGTDEITDATATGGFGEVALEWTIPDTVNFMYVDISYRNSKDEQRNHKVSRFAKSKNSYTVRDTVTGFADTKEYEFTLTPFSKDGVPARPSVVKASPLSPPFLAILATVKIVPDFGGAIVSWENTTGKPVNVVVSYLDNESKQVTLTFPTLKSNTGTISELSGDSKTYIYYTTDNAGNSSEQKTITLPVYAEKEFDKTEWSIPGYDADSDLATAGYSSQATNEGSANKATAIFDGNLATYWHARYGGSGATTYPHWYIIDLGKEVTISRVTMAKRQGSNTTMQKGQRFLTCRAAGVSDKSDPATWSWEDQGSFAFDPTKNDIQGYRLTNNPKARYIKVYFGTEHKGNGDYAMVAEMSVYGQE